AQRFRGGRVADPDLSAVDGDAAGIGFVHPGDHLDQGGFACTVLAQQCVHRPCPNGQIDAVHGEYAAESFRHAGERQEFRVAHPVPSDRDTVVWAPQEPRTTSCTGRFESCTVRPAMRSCRVSKARTPRVCTSWLTTVIGGSSNGNQSVSSNETSAMSSPTCSPRSRTACTAPHAIRLSPAKL